MNFFFDIQQHRFRIRDGLRRVGRIKDADLVCLGLADACPSLVSTGDGREAVIFSAHGYAIVATDTSGCHIPLHQDWMIGVYCGDISSSPQELLLLECDEMTKDLRA